MSLVTRVDLEADERLGLWLSAISYSTRAPKPWQPSRAAVAGYSCGDSAVRVEPTVETVGCPVRKS